MVVAIVHRSTQYLPQDPFRAFQSLSKLYPDSASGTIIRLFDHIYLRLISDHNQRAYPESIHRELRDIREWGVPVSLSY